MKRLTLASFEVSGFGGASTVHYALFRRLQRDGRAACCLNLIALRDAHRFWRAFGRSTGNPDGLDGVENLVLATPWHAEQPALAERLARESPSVVLATGFIAAIAVKQAAPACKVVYLTSGCHQAKRWIETGLARDVREIEERIRTAPNTVPHGDGREKQAIELADFVVPHVPMVRDLYRHFYPGLAGKLATRPLSFAGYVYDEADGYAAHRRPFVERDVDVLFLASDWRRSEKNPDLLARLTERLAHRTVHVVGDHPPTAATAVRHGLVGDRTALFRLYGRSKVVVSPSSFDAAPGVLFEASAMGCNVVASRNCGNWQLCPDSLLAEDYTADAFLACIGRGLEGPLPDHRSDFLEPDGYSALLDIVEALQHAD